MDVPEKLIVDPPAIPDWVQLLPVLDDDDEYVVRFEAFPITSVKATVQRNPETEEKLLALTLRSALGKLRSRSIIRIGFDGPVIAGKKCFENEAAALDYYNRRNRG
jgi:hypothetical protein